MLVGRKHLLSVFLRLGRLALVTSAVGLGTWAVLAPTSLARSPAVFPVRAAPAARGVLGVEFAPLTVSVDGLAANVRSAGTVAEALNEALAPRGVGVVVEARHLCMEMRGVETHGGHMMTSCMLGTFRRDPRTRAEFLDLVRRT